MTQPHELTSRLYEILRKNFGFHSFRPHQEEACLAAATGKDLLLVMPTGAGKSLCYQIPGLARGGTTLVISPLLALIEDQTTKLKQNGLQAERIHSGRSREDSRQVCLDYLNGKLDFLFVAPERLAIPGFLEMLAKKKPSLIAVDEAHCISQWGHDFRPEYRMLGQRLPLLQPTPIIALTATATPKVQEDICQQLGIPQGLKFIHGFRRNNIAIEIVELNPGERTDAVRRLITPPEHRPAIIYSPTRKKAEETADALSDEFKVATYHAGLTAEKREQVQTKFLAGKIDVMVATIAFGMGIDKTNVRTVAHISLPASIEGYYQEIGRAGRDGAHSNAVLMYSFIDRKTHDFFYDRDYPDMSVLEKIYEAATDQPTDSDTLQSEAGVKAELFETALEKLWIHGGVTINNDQNISRGHGLWQKTYAAHCQYRKAQLDQILTYTAAHRCRMLGLIQYFGDQADEGTACGICDFCMPDSVIIKRSRDLTSQEKNAAQKILLALLPEENQATGKLYRDHFNEKDFERRDFERVLEGLARMEFLTLFEDSFEKDGKTIRFRRAAITQAGAAILRADLNASLETMKLPEAPGVKKTKKSKKTKSPTSSLRTASPELLKELKAWRLHEAKSKRVPAFRILSDRVLIAIAESLPKSQAELLDVHGFGPKLTEKYGQDILSIIGSTT